MEVTNPSTPVPGTEQNVPASGSGENANTVKSLKDVVKDLTGREYSSDEDAAKGIAETYKTVTARKPEPTPAPQPQNLDVQILQQQLKATNFYLDHPEYKDSKDIIAKFGTDPEQVIQDPTFQKVFGALKASGDAEKSKSVLTSNNRIAMPKNDDYQADLTAMREGNMPVTEFLAKHKGYSAPTE